MKVNHLITLIAFASFSFVSQQTLATALLSTTSSSYKMEAGTVFADGEVLSRKSSGGLFYAMGGDGNLWYVGEVSKKDPTIKWKVNYGGGLSWVDIGNYGSFADESVNLFHSACIDGWWESAIFDNKVNFMDSIIEWEFDVLYDNAWLDIRGLVEGTAIIDFSIMNMATGNSLYNDDANGLLLLEGESYRLSSSIYNADGGDGLQSLVDLDFINARVELPSPSGAFIFIFALLLFFFSKKSFKNEAEGQVFPFAS